MNELENYIHHYFSISPDDCKKVSALFKTETLNKGDFYLKSGKLCDKMSFIQQGILRIYVSQPGGEVTQWIGTGGFFITDISSFIFRNPSRFNVQALADTRLFTISHQQYLTLGTLVPKWNEFEKLFICSCFVMLENRVFDLISLSAEERYSQLFGQNRELFNQVPLQYLASMLGMTPETFSRIRRKMIS
ncbi:MAG: Crp/Fnr family transcriptional regulator [Mucilaginibacter sp.]|nr:Crp/Fnr family transcriptional regulator [Mucilaginibacter sp.]